LSPGSLVSFYFDDRFAWCHLDSQCREKLTAAIARDGEAVLARRTADQLVLDATIVSGPLEVDELAAMLGSERVLVGPIPPEIDDGVHGVTMTLPDADGIVRLHPY
jgi:hypothetical protein